MPLYYLLTCPPTGLFKNNQLSPLLYSMEEIYEGILGVIGQMYISTFVSDASPASSDQL